MKHIYSILLVTFLLLSCKTENKPKETIPFSSLNKRLQNQSTFLSKDIPKSLNEAESVVQFAESGYFSDVSRGKVHRFYKEFDLSLILYKTLDIDVSKPPKLIKITGNKLTKKFYYELESKNKTIKEVKLFQEINLKYKLINFNIIVTDEKGTLNNTYIFPRVYIKF